MVEHPFMLWTLRNSMSRIEYNDHDQECQAEFEIDRVLRDLREHVRTDWLEETDERMACLDTIDALLER